MSDNVYISNILNAHAEVLKQINNAWQCVFDHTQKQPYVEPLKPAPRVLLLPDGQTVDPSKITDAYVSDDEVEYETIQGSFTVNCADGNEAKALCKWMHEQRGATVEMFKSE